MGQGPSEGPWDPRVSLQQQQVFLLPCFLSVEMKQQQMPRDEPLESQKKQQGSSCQSHEANGPT